MEWALGAAQAGGGFSVGAEAVSGRVVALIQLRSKAHRIGGQFRDSVAYRCIVALSLDSRCDNSVEVEALMEPTRANVIRSSSGHEPTVMRRHADSPCTVAKPT